MTSGVAQAMTCRPGCSTCVTTNSSLYVQHLYSSGCSDVVVSGAKTIVSAHGTTHFHVIELALGRQDFEGTSGDFKYGFPSIVDGQRSEAIVIDTDMEKAPTGLQSKHHWGPSAADWQSVGAVDATTLGATGDGVTDDWKALQEALDENVIVVLPKGLYRISRPLLMRKHGSSLIGVGAARSFLMPMSSGFAVAAQPVLDMAAEDATVKGVTIVTWSHLSPTYAMSWRGDGFWRQAFTTREPESAFPLFKSMAHPRSIVPKYTTPTAIDHPLVIISGGGAFYDFDLDFGCCFGHTNPPNASLGPAVASTDEILLQRPGFRTLLINASKSGLRFYPHNTEQAFSDAYTEIANSFNVTLYNAKSENNYAVLWIHDSDLVSVLGFGGNACPFPNSSHYNGFDVRGPSFAHGYKSYMPSSFRVQRSSRITLANIVNLERITNGTTKFMSAGIGWDPRTYNMILYQDIEGVCDPLKTPHMCSASPVLDRPVLWRWTGARLPADMKLV